MAPRSRRALLQATGLLLTAGAAGCVGLRDPEASDPQQTPASRTTAPPPTGTSATRSPSTCGNASITARGPDPRGYQPEGETVTLYKDYLTVAVTIREEDPPPLRGFIEHCEGRTEVDEPLSTGRQTIEFGPFGHHCIQDYGFWLAGCRPTGTA